MNDYKWLEYFFAYADFGPAHEDVVEMIYEDYKKRGGDPVDYMEPE